MKTKLLYCLVSVVAAWQINLFISLRYIDCEVCRMPTLLTPPRDLYDSIGGTAGDQDFRIYPRYVGTIIFEVYPPIKSAVPIFCTSEQVSLRVPSFAHPMGSKYGRGTAIGSLSVNAELRQKGVISCTLSTKLPCGHFLIARRTSERI
jgi:hypothetical protein